MASTPKYDLEQLLKLTQKLFPTRFSSAPEAKSRLSRLIYTPFVGMKLLSVRGDVKGLTGKTYKVILLFQRVDYSETEDKKHSIKVKVDNKKSVWMVPVRPGYDVKFRCSCPDAYFTSLYYAWQSKNLYGPKPRKYVRKTTTYPERNPAKLPILCKHLISVVQRVRKSKYYKGGK